MKSFFVALIEVDSNPEENEGRTFVKTMNEFKEAGKAIGNVTYYRVIEESQYRRVENEIRRNARP